MVLHYKFSAYEQQKSPMFRAFFGGQLFSLTNMVQVKGLEPALLSKIEPNGSVTTLV